MTDIRNIRPVLEVMQRIGMPLLVHGEVTDRHVDIFDREAVFIDRILAPLLADFPALKVVFEHITTAEAAAFVEAGNSHLAATITPHHLAINRNAMFEGGIRPHFYCLPVAKREPHRRRCARRRPPDRPSSSWAPIPHRTPSPPRSACGCAGIFNAPYALESYARTFEEEGALDRLEAFAAEHGPRFYGLPLNPGKVTLERARTEVPETIGTPASEILPFLAGESLNWRFVGGTPD